MWTIDNNVVTFAKIQQISTNTLLGRDTAGTGNVEEITLNSTLAFNGSQVLGVVDNTSTQKVRVLKDGVLTGTRDGLNFLAAIGSKWTVTDDAGNSEVEISLSEAPWGIAATTVLGDSIALSTTSYWALGGILTDNTTETNRVLYWNLKGFMGNWSVATYTTQSATGALVLTLRVAGADSALVVTIPAGSAAGNFTDYTHEVAIAVSNRLAIKAANAATATSATVGWVIGFKHTI